MNFLQEIASNRALVSGVMAWFFAQFIKSIIELWSNKRFSVERIFGSGGMPSSHSSTVCAVAIAAAYQYGVSSYEFAIAFILAIIVMYDAMGVRRETGKQAKLLNLLLKDNLFEFENKDSFEERLKELVGHTPLQVFMGAVLGIIVGYIVSNILF